MGYIVTKIFIFLAFKKKDGKINTLKCNQFSSNLDAADFNAAIFIIQFADI